VQDAFDEVKQVIETAEERKRQGDYAAARALYRQTLKKRLPCLKNLAAELTHADILLVERLADLEILYNETEIADDLFAALRGALRQTDNLFYSDYFLLKQMHLAIECGNLRRAEVLLDSLTAIGELEEEVSELGLRHWENRIYWFNTDKADRAFALARLYLNLGRLCAANGQYADALTFYSRGLTHANKKLPVQMQGVRTQLQLSRAAALLEKGDLAAAQEQLTALEDYLSQNAQLAQRVRYLELVGKLALLTGAFGKALTTFKESIAVCTRYGFAQAAIQATLNLCEVLILVNQTVLAKRLLQAAMQSAEHLEAERRKEQSEKSDDRQPESQSLIMRVRYLMQLAAARSRSVSDEIPLATVSEMWEAQPLPVRQPEAMEDAPEMPQSPNYLAFFEDRAMMFQWHLGLSDFTTSAAILTDLQQAFLHQTDSKLIAVRLQILAAMQAYYEDDFTEAARLLNNERVGLRDLGLKPELWQAQRILGWCRKKLGYSEAEQQALAKETQELLTEMTASLAPEEQAIFLLNKWTADEEYIAAEINRLSRLKRELAQASIWQRPRLRLQLWQQLDALLTHIDRYKDALARRMNQQGKQQRDEKQAAPASSLWKRLLQHSPRRATLSFLVLPDRVFIARRGWMSLDFGVSAVTRLRLRELIRKWHEPIRAFVNELQQQNRGLGRREEQSDKSAAGLPQAAERGLGRRAEATLAGMRETGKTIGEEVAEALQIPDFLRRLPKRIRGLTIVPDDSLHGFPFAAIIHDGDYLIKRFALSVAFETAVAPMPAPPIKRDYALTVGVSQGIGDLPPLTGTTDELQEVSDWLAQQRLPEQRLDDFSEGSIAVERNKVLHLLEQAKFFHIASHGIFQVNAPNQSGMALAAVTGGIETLSLRDLTLLDLRGLKHTTLSSCWSADNFVVPGRWVISLPETLWRAGSESVLGCLWVVSDTVAIALMRQFYHYLNKYPRDKALQQAQLDCLEGRLPDCKVDGTDHPLFWAGYNLYGDYRRLKL